MTKARMASFLRDQVAMPRYFPPVLDMRSGLDGRLWIREFLVDTSGAQWLILDSLGREERRLRVPGSFRLLLPTAGAMYGVLKDELEVETVVKVQISEDAGLQATSSR